MRIWTKLTAMLLAGLLLCSCGAEENAEVITIPAEVPQGVPANWELYSGNIYEITSAGFELFELIYPHSYIAYSSMGGRQDGFTVDCGGADIEAFAASGILPEEVILDMRHAKNEGNPRLFHDIPRAPKSKTEFDDGMSLKMARKTYPTYPEYVEFIIETERGMQIDFDVYLYKWIDGEWQVCPKQTYAHVGWGYGFEAGVPQTWKLGEISRCLGEGLYRIELGGYDIEDGEEYYVEFTVSADAEPLEPLPEEEQATREGYALNFFWQCELPESCTVLSMPGQIEWPTAACSYSVVQKWSRDTETIVKKLLGDDYTYDPATETYTAGTKTLRFTEGGLSLTDSAPEVQAMKLAYPFVYTAKEWSGDYSAADSALRHLTGGMDYEGINREVFNIELKFALEDALEAKKTELSEAEFQSQYGEFTGFSFEPGISRAYYVRSPMIGDIRCTNADNGSISGPQIFCIMVDGKAAELSVSGMGGSFSANDDTAAVVPPYDAAAAVLPELWKIEEEFAVTGAEFSYAYHGGDLSVLRPTWVFTVEYGGSEHCFGVDALTGELVT